MSKITMSKQSPASGGIRLARIQYSSPLRNQNLYFSHRYDIKVRKEHIYSSGGNTVDYSCRLYCSTNGIVSDVMDQSFYIYDSGTYIDLCINLTDTWTRLTVEVETYEIGSVSLKCDAYSLASCTRLLVLNPTLNSMFNKLNGKNFSYYHDFSLSYNIKVNNMDIINFSLAGDTAVISQNSIVKTPTNWTLTKGTDIQIAGETIGSNWTLTTNGSYRGTMVFY